MNLQDRSRQRGSEEAWLGAAHELLTEAGVEAVKVMAMAQRLGLSRTGFYWHFKDREALLETIIRQWEDRNTGELVARTGAYAETVCEALFNLFDCWLDNDLFDAPLDLAIRNWGRTDPALQSRLDRADARRQSAIAGMFARYGFDQAEAEVRAMTVIYTQIGYISMRVREDRATRLARMPAYVEVFSGRRPTENEIDRFMARHTG
jgi:AcrR family transcriptional regulator